MSSSSQYRSSSSLQAPRAAVSRSVAFATQSSSDGSGMSNPNERRYWSAKFGLGPSSSLSGSSAKTTAPARVTFETTSRAAVSAVAFSPRGRGGGSSKSQQQHHHQMAVVAGPRVALYGPGENCSLARALSRDGSRRGRGGGEPNLFGDNVDGEQESGGDYSDVRPDRTVGTGGSPARCAAFRRDGRLVAVGTDAGDVRVCDATSRATLRTFRAAGGEGRRRQQNHPVRSVAWLGDGKRLVSGGDDAVVRVWDLGGGERSAGDIGGGLSGDSAGPVMTMPGHGDSVRSVVVLKASAGTASSAETRHLAVSGSYDHTVRVWDVGSGGGGSNDAHGGAAGDIQDRCTSVMDHGAPVEDLLVLPPTEAQPVAIVASAGGTYVKLWNPITGVCVATVPTKHSKTITSFCLMDIVRNDDEAGSGKRGDNMITNRRLLTGGLDGLIRIHSADDVLAENNNLPYLHGVRTPHPITALRASPGGSRLVVGTSNGLVTVRQRGKIIPQGVSLKRKERPQSGTYAYFMRGADVSADADDHVVILERKKRLRSFDVMLRQFRYGDALDEALASRQPDAIIAVLEELGKRRGLTQSLSNRDEETLEPILAFTSRYIAKPRYTPVLIGVADRLCDIYCGVVGQSEIIDEHFDKLRRHVRDECRVQKTLLKLVGQIDSVMCAAEMQAGMDAEKLLK